MRLSLPHVILLSVYYWLIPETSAYTRHTNSLKNNSDLIPWAEVPQFYKDLIDEAQDDLASSPKSDVISRNKGNTDFISKSLEDEEEKKASGADDKKKLFNINRFLPFALTTKLSQWRNNQSDKDEEDRQAKDLKKALRHQDSFNLDRANTTPTPDRFKSEDDQVLTDHLQVAPKVLFTLINSNPRLVSKLLKKLFNSSTRPEKFKIPPLEPPDDLDTNFFISPKVSLAYKEHLPPENVRYETELINSQSATTSGFTLLTSQNSIMTNKIDSVQSSTESTNEIPDSTGSSYTESFTGERQIESKPVGKSFEKPRTTTANPVEESQVQEVESILKTVMEILSVLNKTEESSTSSSNIPKSLACDANIVDNDGEGEFRNTDDGKQKDVYEFSDEDLNKVLKSVVNLVGGVSKSDEIDLKNSTKLGGSISAAKQTGNGQSPIKEVLEVAEETSNNDETKSDQCNEGETAKSTVACQNTKQINPFSNNSNLLNLLNKLADQDKETDQKLKATDQKDDKFRMVDGVSYKEMEQTQLRPANLLLKPIISSEEKEPNRWKEVTSAFTATTEPSVLLDVPLNYYNQVLKLINGHQTSRKSLSESESSPLTLQNSENYNDFQKTNNSEPSTSLLENYVNNKHSYDYIKGTSSLDEAWLDNDVSEDYKNHEQQETSLFGLGGDKTIRLEDNKRNISTSSVRTTPVQNSTEVDFIPSTFENFTVIAISLPADQNSTEVVSIESGVENSTVVAFMGAAEQMSPVVGFSPPPDVKSTAVAFVSPLNASCVTDGSNVVSAIQPSEIVRSNSVENTTLLAHIKSKKNNDTTEEEKAIVASASKKQLLKDSSPKKQSLFNKIFCSLFGSSSPGGDVSCVKRKKVPTNSSNIALNDNRELLEVKTCDSSANGGTTTLPPILGHKISNKNDFKEYFLTDKGKTDLAFLKYIPGAFRMAPTHPTALFSSRNVDKGQSKSSVNRVYNMTASSSPKETIKGYESVNNSETSIQIPLPITALKTDNKSVTGHLLLISSDQEPNIVNKVVAQQTQVNLSKDKSWQKDPIRGYSNYFTLSTEHSKHNYSTISQLKLVAGKEKNNLTVGISLPVGESFLPTTWKLPKHLLDTTPPYEALLELIKPLNEKHDAAESESDNNASVTDNQQPYVESTTHSNSFSSTKDLLEAADTVTQRYEDFTSTDRRVTGHRGVETVTRAIIGNVPPCLVPKVNLTLDVITDINPVQNYEIISGPSVLAPTAQNASWDKLKISPLVIIESTGNVTKKHKSNHSRGSIYMTQNTPDKSGFSYVDTVSNVVNNPSKVAAVPRDEMANIKLYIYDPPFEEAYSYSTTPFSLKPTETTPTDWEKRFHQKLLPVPNLELMDRSSTCQHKPSSLEATDGMTDSPNIKLVNLPIGGWGDTTSISNLKTAETPPASSPLNSIVKPEAFLTNDTFISSNIGSQGEIQNNLELETSRVQSEKNKTHMLHLENNSFQASDALKEDGFPKIHNVVETKNLTKIISDFDYSFDPSYDRSGIDTSQSIMEYWPEDNGTDIVRDSTVCIGEVEDASNAATLIDKTTESKSEIESNLKNENSAIQYTVSDDRKTHHNSFSTPVYVVHNFMKGSKEISSRRVMWKRKKTTYPALTAVEMSTKSTQVPINQIVTPEPGSKSPSSKEDNSNTRFLNDFMEALNNALKVENDNRQLGELLDVSTISTVTSSASIDKARNYANSCVNITASDTDYFSTEVTMFPSEQTIFTTVELFTETAGLPSEKETQAAKEIKIKPDLDIAALLTHRESTEHNYVTLPLTLTQTQQNINSNLVNASKFQDKESIGPSLAKNSKGLNRTKTLAFIDTLMQSDNHDLYAVLNWTRFDNTSSSRSLPLDPSKLSLEGNVRTRNTSALLEEPTVIGKVHFDRDYSPGIGASLNNSHRYYKYRTFLQNRHYSGEDDKRQSRLSENNENEDVSALGFREGLTNQTKSKRNPVVQSIIATTATPNQIVVHRVITTENGRTKVTMSRGFSNLAEKMTGDNEAADKEAELRAFMGLNTSWTHNMNTDPRLKAKDQPVLLSRVGYGFTSERSSYNSNLRMRLNGFDGTTPPPLFQLHNYLSDARTPEAKDPHQIFNIYILNKAKNSQNPSVSNSTQKITTTSHSPLILNKAKNKKNPFYKRMNIFRKFGLCRDAGGQLDTNSTTEKINDIDKLNGTITEDIACLSTVKPELKDKFHHVTPVNFRATSTEKVVSKPTKQVKSTCTIPSPTTSSAVESLSHLTNINSSSDRVTTLSYTPFQNASTDEIVIRMSEALGAGYVTSNPNSYVDPSSYNRWINGSQINATGEPYVLWIPEYRYKIYNDYLYNISNRMNLSNTAVELKGDKNSDRSTPRNKFKLGFKNINVFNLKGNETEKSSSKGSYNATTSHLVDVDAVTVFPSTSTQGVLPQFLYRTTQVNTGLDKTNCKIPNISAYEVTSEGIPDIRSSLNPQTSTEHKMLTNNWASFNWYTSTPYGSFGLTHVPDQNSTFQRKPIIINETNQISSIDSKGNILTNQTADIMAVNVTRLPTTEHFTNNFYPANTSYSRFYDPVTSEKGWNFTDSVVENTSPLIMHSTVDFITVPSAVHVVSSLWTKQELRCTASDDANAPLAQNNYSSQTVTSSTAQYISNVANLTDKMLPTNVKSISQTTCLQPVYAKVANTVSPSALRITSDVFETSTFIYNNVSSGNTKIESPSIKNVTEVKSFNSCSEKVVDERLEICTTPGPLYSEAIYVPSENGFETPTMVSETHLVKDTEQPESHISTKDLVVSVTRTNVVSLEEMKESTKNLLMTDAFLTVVTTEDTVQETTIGGVNKHLTLTEEAAIDKPSTSVDSEQVTSEGGETDVSSNQTISASPDTEDLPSVASSGESSWIVGPSSSSTLPFLDDIITVVAQELNDNMSTNKNEPSDPTDITETINTEVALDVTDMQDVELNLLTDEQTNPSSATPLQVDFDNATVAATNQETLDLDSVSLETSNADCLDSSESDSIPDSNKETEVEENVELNNSLNDFSTQGYLVLTPNPEINLQLIDSDQQVNEESSDSNLNAEEVSPADDESKSENETESSENIEVTWDSEDKGENSTDKVLTLTASRSKTVGNDSQSLDVNGNDQWSLFKSCLNQINDSQSGYKDIDTNNWNDFGDTLSTNLSSSLPGNVMVGALEKATKWSLFEGSRVSTQCTVDVEDTTCPLTTEQTTCEDSHSDQSTTDGGAETTSEATDQTTCETTCDTTDETTCETTCDTTDETTCETTCDTTDETTCETTCDTTDETTSETTCETSDATTCKKSPETTCKYSLSDEFDLDFDKKYGFTTEARKSHPITRSSCQDGRPTKRGKKKKGKGHHSTAPSVCSAPVYTQDEGILSSENEFWRTLSTEMCANSVTKSGRLKIEKEKSVSYLNLEENPGESIRGKTKNKKETVDDNLTKCSKFKNSGNTLNDNGVKIDINIISEDLHSSVSTTTEDSYTSDGLSINLHRPDQSGGVENTVETVTEPLGFRQSTPLFPFLSAQRLDINEEDNALNASKRKQADTGYPEELKSKIMSKIENDPVLGGIPDSIYISETLNQEANELTVNHSKKQSTEEAGSFLDGYFVTTVPQFTSLEFSTDITQVGSIFIENSDAKTVTEVFRENADSLKGSVTEFSDNVREESESQDKPTPPNQAGDNQAGHSGDAAALGEFGHSENDGDNSCDYPEGKAADDSPECTDAGVEDLTDLSVDGATESTDINSSTDESNEESIAKKVYMMSILNDRTSRSQDKLTLSKPAKTVANTDQIISSLGFGQTDSESDGGLKGINRCLGLGGLVDSLESNYVSSAKSKKSVIRISCPKETIFAQEKQDPPGSEAPIDEIRPNVIGPGRQISGLSTTHSIKETKGVTSPSMSTKHTYRLRNTWLDETQENKPCNRTLGSESSICSTLLRPTPPTETANLFISTQSGSTPRITKINSCSLYFAKPQIGRNSLENAGPNNKGLDSTEWRADKDELLDISTHEDHIRPESHSLTDRIWEVLTKAVMVQSYNPHSVETEKRSDLLDFNSSQTDKSANDSKADLLNLPKSANSIFINENSIGKLKDGTGKSRKDGFEQKNRGRKIFGLIQKEFNNSKIYNGSDMNYYLSKIQIPSVDEPFESITTEPKALLLSTSSTTVVDEMERKTKPATSRTIADLLKIDPLLRYILDLGSARTNKPLISDHISNMPVETGRVVDENTSPEGEKRLSDQVNNATVNPQSVLNGEFENWDDLVDQFRDPILNYDYPSDASGHSGQDSTVIQKNKQRRTCREELSRVNHTSSLNDSKQESGIFEIGSDTDRQFVDLNKFNNVSSAPNLSLIGLNTSDICSWKKKSRTEDYLFAKDSEKFEKKEKNKLYEFSMGTYRPLHLRTKRRIDFISSDSKKDGTVRCKSDDGGNRNKISEDKGRNPNRAVRSKSTSRKIEEVLNPWEGGKKGNYVSPSERRKIAKILEAIELNSFDDSDDVIRCTDLSSAKKSIASKPRNKAEARNILSHKVKQCRRKQGYLLNSWGKNNKTVVYPYFSQVENPIKGKCIGSRPNTLSYNISESFFDKGDNGTALLCHVDLKITTKNYTLAPESTNDERTKYSCFYNSSTTGGKPNIFVQYSPVYQSETNFSHAPQDYTTFLVKRVHKSLDQEYKYVVVNLNNIFYITVELNGDVYTYSDRTTPLGSRTVAKKPGRRKKNYKYLPIKKRKNKKNAMGTRSEPKNKSNKKYLPRKRIKLDLIIAATPH